MSTKLQETELKFVLTPEAAAQLRCGVLRDGDECDVTSTYYDTPDRALTRAGATLRLRRTDSAWLQTLKGGPGASIARFEDERPAKEGRLDPALFSRQSYERLGVARPSKLQPLFETRVNRRTLLLEHADVAVELALDHGVIQAGDGRTPIEELELELKAGTLADLFAAARDFVEITGVSVSLISKSERGHRLASGHPTAPVAFAPPALSWDAPAHEGFQTLFLAGLHQLCANVELLRAAAAPGAVHQARVALRRLKTYLNAFEDLATDEQTPAIKASLKRLTAVFETARALDVFRSDSFMPSARHETGAAGFGAALLSVQAVAYTGVEAAVRRSDCASDLFNLIEWTLCGPWLEKATAKSPGVKPMGATARTLLSRCWRRLKRRGRRLDWSDARARHTLRIQTKKMRYLTEAFAPVEKSSAFVERLKVLQAELGALNDIATAPAAAQLALNQASSEIVFAAGEIVGRRRAETPRRLKTARKAFRRVVRSADRWDRLGLLSPSRRRGTIFDL